MLKAPIKQKFRIAKDKKRGKIIILYKTLVVSFYVYHGTSIESELDIPANRSHQ